MKYLEYTIKLESPVIISAISGDDVLTKTLNYIPFSAMKGLLANSYIQSRNKEISVENAHYDQKFRELFLEDKLLITNSYLIERNKDIEDRFSRDGFLFYLLRPL